MLDRHLTDQPRVLVIAPEWGSWERVAGTFSSSLSDELRKRIRAWNTVWQTVLDPQIEIRWPDAGVGQQWIAEGKSLVVTIQAELGPSVRVIEGFAVYDPEGTVA